MTSRKLSLRKESLTELTTADLEVVAGASGLPCDPTTLVPTNGPCTPDVYTLRNCG